MPDRSPPAAPDPGVSAEPQSTARPRASEVPADHRFGFVALCGRPNVGKSTLLNALLGDAVAVTSAYPQTTRERMLGIWSDPGFQAVLVDTPGIHRARSELNRFMVDQAMRAARDVDLVLCLAETPLLTAPEQAEAWKPGEVACEVWQRTAELGHPVVLVLTKVDRLSVRGLLLPVIAAWAEVTRASPPVAVVPTAVPTLEGLDVLRHEVLQRLPSGPPHYDGDQMSDRPLRWHAAELTRVALFDHLRDELPYSCAVEVTSFRERRDRDVVEAMIHVERESQKSMVIGKRGAVVTAISRDAGARVARLTGRPCDVRLRVSVSANWTRDRAKLQALGYRDPEER